MGARGPIVLEGDHPFGTMFHMEHRRDSFGYVPRGTSIATRRWARFALVRGLRNTWIEGTKRMDAHKTTPKIKPPKRRLGRGLGSLIGSTAPVEVRPTATVTIASASSTDGFDAANSQTAAPTSEEMIEQGGLSMLAVEVIEPNPHQPRQDIDQATLAKLADSIRSAGLMQPLVVRRKADGAGGYELIAGERRWRAAQLAGASRVPAVVREADDQTSAELALIENMHREDLNPMDRAQAFDRLSNRFGLTHKAVADLVGIDRSSVTNHLRLLELDPFSQAAVRNGELSLGHAKVLLTETDESRREEISRSAAQHGWSVRELERQIASGSTSARKSAVREAAATAARPAHLDDLERRLAEHLGTRVDVRTGTKKGSGQLVISFFDLEQFDGILRKMSFKTDGE